MFLAEVGLEEMLWSLLTIFFMVMYFMMLFSVIVDLFRDHELGAIGKALWLLALLVFPLLSLLVYVLVRGDGMARRSYARARATESEFQDYLRGVAGSGPADQIVRAKALYEDGVITTEEFDNLKRKALAA